MDDNSYIDLSFSLWRNSVLVSSVTFFNTLCFALALFIWATNRQTQIRPSKSQSNTNKSVKFREEKDQQVLSKSDQDLFSHDWGRQKSRETLVKNFSMDFNFDEDEEEDEEDGDLSDDEGYGENDDNDNDNEDDNRPSFEPVNPQLRTLKKDMLNYVTKMNIFSYLSDEAFRECLSYMKYIDLPDAGSAILSANTSSVSCEPLDVNKPQLDGSLYIVISGSVECSCHLVDEGINKSSPSSSEHVKFQFKAGPGDTITSQLAMVSDLVRLYQEQNCDFIKPILNSVHVTAHTTTPNTRLICVPSTVYVAILKKYPEEVYHIAQTILGRTQRVIMQILIQKVGLKDEIISRGYNAMKESNSKKEWNDNLYTCQQECERICNENELQKNITPLQLSSEIKYMAAEAAADRLGTRLDKDIATIQDHSSVVAIRPGGMIVHAGQKSESVYFVIRGEIEIGNFIEPIDDRCLGKSFNNDQPSCNDCNTISFSITHEANERAILGQMAVFTGEVSMASIRASTKKECVYLLQIPKCAYLSLVLSNNVILVQSLGSILNEDISQIIHFLDWGLRHLSAQAGSMLAQRGQLCKSLWVVLNGRLRSVAKEEGKTVIKHEHGRGACIGDVFDAWPQDVYAIRNSELAELPLHVIEIIMQMFPSCALSFARVIANQVHQHYTRKGSQCVANSDDGLPRHKLTVATIAIVPVCFRYNDDGASSFCQNIKTSLKKIAPCTIVSKSLVRKKLGKKVNNLKNIVHALKLTRLLGDLEENNTLVLYEADSNFSWWTKMCIQQSDCVLLVINSKKAPPNCIHLQKFLAHTQLSRLKKRVELILLREGNESNQTSDQECHFIGEQCSQWIERLPFHNGTHWIRVQKDGLHEKDILRMCRRITGCSLGLCLGGGGARGIAHLGVIKALLDCGVLVDIVGGTSQGAFVGALYAKNPDDFDALLRSARVMADRMSSMRDKVLDLTLPLVSYFDGRRFNKVIMNSIGEQTKIEELILNFFCVSTNLKEYCQVVHKNGCCWKFIRASMSLHGYLPPISEDGSLLLDGGYTSIVPNDVMSKEFGTRSVIAVDVSREEMPDYYEYGSNLSGFWLLWNSLNPLMKTVRVPSMGELSQRLIWVNSSRQQQKIADNCDLFLSPPVHEYGTLDYHLFDEIFSRGYRYAKPKIEKFIKDEEFNWVVHLEEN